MLRIGIVGTGTISGMFCRAAALANDVELFGVYSRSAKKGESFLNEQGLEMPVYTDLEAMANSTIDAVYIASPNSLHFTQAKVFLEANKHVLCEKPVTVTPGELSLLQSLAKDKGLIFLEGVMSLHSVNRPHLESALGEIGTIREARICFSQLSSKYGAFKRGELPNIFNPEYATGALMDIGVYCVNLAVWLFGVPESVSAHAVFLPGGADGAGCALFKYGDKVVTLGYSKTGQGVAGSEFLGDTGSVSLEAVSYLSGLKLHAKEDVKPVGLDIDHIQALTFEIEDFYKYINDYNANKEEYHHMTHNAMSVSKVMEEMRKQANIVFVRR